MGHSFEALLMGVGIYGAIAAAMLALWGAAMTAIIAIAAIFRERGGGGIAAGAAGE
ncbi:MAG: hypothetical protein ABSE69_06795 [Roseiarcus sp.]|jgi:hypothetical protein